MKLQFDQNLSDRLPALLATPFPHSAHVRSFSMNEADDETIWNFARDNEYTIVTKDDDFHQRALVHGPPPKVVYLKVGNCPNRLVIDLLKSRVSDIDAFQNDAAAAVLLITRSSVFKIVLPPTTP